MTKKESGTIRLDDDLIRYSSDYGGFELALHDVRIIGESTNQNGPFTDDYFLCFVTNAQCWYEASFYAEGRDEFLRMLGERLGVHLKLGLCASADFASRIVWPQHLVGNPLFKYEDVVPCGFWQRLRTRLGFPLGNTQTLSEIAVRAMGKGR